MSPAARGFPTVDFATGAFGQSEWINSGSRYVSL